MTFIQGKLCQLKVLQESDEEARIWTDAVMRGLTTQHLFTGSFPMRPIDVKAEWEKERKAGSVQFGIWIPCAHKDADGCEEPAHFIGTCGLHSHREIYRSWEARWLIFDAGEVGKGIGEEAVRLLTDYAFRRLNAHRVWLGVSADNLRAVKCYLSVSYKIEGTFKDELFYDGKYHDVYRMGILEDQWQCIKQS